MTIDKRWTTLRNRNSDEFWDGLNKFIEIAKEHADIDGLARCPCGDCLNMLSHTPDTIHAHIYRRGFQQSYQQWIFHGEVNHPVVDEVASMTDEMVDVLNDLVGEQNTNEDSDEENSNAGGTNVDQEFAELFEEMNTELYPGCTWLSSLNSLAKLLHMKAMNKWTDSSFNQLLEYLKFAFPKDNKIPASYYEAKKKMRKIGLGYETIHACKHDCCLFWKEHASKDKCPVCGDSRWDDDKTTGKKVPHKVLRYFPLTSRLRRMYSSRHTAKEMTWHRTGRSEEGKMRHPVDGAAWKEFDTKYPDFAKEPRNIRLALAADGFNPFGSLTNPHSTWPVILTTYNTPPWLCMKESSLMLTLLIPGPRAPGKDMDVFLRPLVDELKVLWDEGVQVRDATTNTVFTMRAALLWTINDFPARSSLSGWSGQGYKACPTCNEDTPSCRVKRKTAYVGHRRFLPTRHHWRSSRLFNGKSERRGPPKRFSPTTILRQLAYVQIRKPGKHPRVGGVKRPRDPKELNWSKRSIFYELKYWSSLLLKHNLDVMHIEKNVCDSLLGTLLMNDNSKDTMCAREDLKILGIRKEYWLQESDNKTTKPHPKYSFTVENRQKLCQFIKGVKLPDGFGSNFKKKVNENCTNITGLKSHDCHILMQRLLPIGVQGRGYLDKNIATTICELCTFFKQICARTLDVEDMMKAEKELINILCKMEMIFPPAFFDIMIHLVLHLPEEAILGGPVYFRWMYPFERYMKKLKNYVRNKAKPEGSIAEGYVADEALTFCSMYLQGVQTVYNRPDRNEDVVIPKRQLSVFRSQCRPTSKSKVVLLEEKVRKAVEWYVLNNCSEVEVYIRQFTSEYPEGNLQNDFVGWFYKKMYRLRQAGSPECTDELYALAHGSHFSANYYTACIVNGVRFVTHSRDISRITQNSGVSVPGEGRTAYYGQLEDIVELRYLHGYSVVLFRCKWFNTDHGRCVIKNNITSINVSSESFKNDQFILATQAKQVFYVEDPSRNPQWRVVEDVNHRKLWDLPPIIDDNEIDIVHNNNSSNLVLITDLGDMPNAPLESVDQSSIADEDIPTSPVLDDDNFSTDEDEDLVFDDDEPTVDPDVVERDLVPHYCSSDDSD